MSDLVTRGRHRIAEATRHARNVAMVVSAVALAVIVVLFASGGSSSSGSVAETSVYTLLVALAVTSVSQGARMMAMFVDGLRQPGDRRLPPLGTWSRVLCRCFLTSMVCTFLFVPITWVADALDEEASWSPGVDTAVTLLLAVSLIGALAAGLTWAVIELATSSQRARRPDLR